MLKARAVLLCMLLPYPALAQVQTTIAPPTLPNLDAQASQGSPSDPDAIYCRPPQHRTDSMLMGPRVCMTNKQWSDLHAGGFDIGPDGSKVSVEKHVNMLSH